MLKKQEKSETTDKNSLATANNPAKKSMGGYKNFVKSLLQNRRLRFILILLAIILIGSIASWLYLTGSKEDGEDIAADPAAQDENIAKLTAGLEGATLNEDISDREKAIHYLNTANAFRDAANTDKQLEYLLLSYQQYSKLETVAIQIADIYRDKSDHSSEQTYLRHALDIITEKINDNNGAESLGLLYFAQGEIYSRLEDSQNARTSFTKSLDALKQQPVNAERDAAIADVEKRINAL